MELAACFYINLDERPERGRLLRAHESRLGGVRLERWPAVRPSRADLESVHARILARGVDDYVETENAGAYHLGVIGCYLSHVGLMEHIAERFAGSDAPVLVLEDDFVPRSRFLPRLARKLAQVPPDWDLVRIDCWGRRRAPRIARGVYRLDERWPRNHFGGTHAVLHRPSRLPKLLGLLESAPIADMDGVWRKRGIVGRIGHYAVFTGASRIALFPSDIRPGHQSTARRMLSRLVRL